MLDRFEQQVLRAALAELSGDIPSQLTDPASQAKLLMTRTLLAHVLGQQDAEREFSGITQEVNALQKAERDEQALLTADPTTSTQASPITAEVLTTYLRAKLNAPGLTVTDVQASLGGFSKQTYILKLSGGEAYDNRLVLRRDQEGGPVEVLAADEYPVIKLMHERGVPVAEPLVVDRAPPFGATAMVMRMVPGASAFDLSGLHLGSEGRSAALSLARVLGQIHRTPISALALPAETSGLSLREHVRRQVQCYEDQWQRRSVGRSPTLAAAFAWLHAHIPEAGSGPALVHGDASLRNLMVADGRESAMLDWELWHVGDANEDLAYCRNEIEQVVSWDDFMQEYLAHGGLPYDARSGEYYAVFGAVRNAVFAQSCLHGFVGAENPEAKFAYGALVLGRRLIYGMAEKVGVSH